MAKLLDNTDDTAEKNEEQKEKRGLFGRSFFNRHKNETDEMGSLAGENAYNLDNTEQSTEKATEEDNIVVHTDAQSLLYNEDGSANTNTITEPIITVDSHTQNHSEFTEFNELTPASIKESNNNELNFYDDNNTQSNSAAIEETEISFNQPLELSETTNTTEEINMNETEVEEIEDILGDMEASGIDPEAAELIPNTLAAPSFTDATSEADIDSLPSQENHTDNLISEETNTHETTIEDDSCAPTATLSTELTKDVSENENVAKTESNSISLFDSTPEIKEALSPYEESIKSAQEAEAPPTENTDNKVADTDNEDAPPSKLGERMIELGLISKDQLHVALRDQKERKQMLGEVLVHHGFVTEATLTEVLSDSSGYERFDLEKAVIDTSLLNTVPKDIATNYRVFPVSLKDDTLFLAMADVYDIFAIDQIRRFFPAKIEITPLISSDKEIATCIQKYFGYELSIDGLLTEIESEGTSPASSNDIDESAVAEGDFSHPVVRLVNSLLLDAIKVGASDMHFEPEGNYLRIRYRIDGEMRQIRSLHKSHWSSVANRIKIMGNMDVANRIEAQDGRIQMMLGNSSIDFRVSSLPTIHGENFVLRVLDKSTAQVAIQQLGFSEENFQMLERLIAKPEGIIIVTGPTGSGKTTTLYAVLNHLNSIDVNIMTLEDPVEYELPLIRQCQVREGSTVDFEHGIKALLRQDPDIILIGEVRNQITAIQTLRAAMTGHQVFTTLHTNSAVGALPRLMDLGIHAGLMAGNIVGILGQRLSRKLCPHCKEMKPITEEEAKLIKIPYDPNIMVGHKVGCPECEHIGLKGRVAIAEIMPMAKELEDMLARGETTEVIRRAAVKYGFKPMANDALDKILNGEITIESAMKVIDMDERLELETSETP